MKKNQEIKGKNKRKENRQYAKIKKEFSSKEYENFEDEEESKESSGRRKLPSFGKSCIVILIIIVISIISARYVTDESFRTFVDTKVIKKEISSDTLKKIDIDSENNPNIYAFSKYIAVLSKSKLKMYNSSGKQVTNLEVNISSAIFDSEGNYLFIGEKTGTKLYLISGLNTVWQSTVEGEISRVSVNKNGYTSVIVKNTTYKSVIIVFSPTGKEVFRYNLSSAYAICSDISADNQYLAIGDVDYSGTIVKSNIKIFSMQKAISDPVNAIVNTYESKTDEIVINIDYSNKNYAVCMFNTYIEKVSESGNETDCEFNNDVIFSDISLRNNIAVAEKQSSGNFSYAYQMRIKSTNNKNESLFILNNSMPKSVMCYGNNIGINYGNEIQIVQSNGWLIKRYTSEKEVKSLVLGEKIAGVVYKDRIEIINF